MAKRKKRNATKEDVVAFIMSHDGDPTPAFKAKVEKNPDERRLFEQRIQDTLLCPFYALEFFFVTRKVLSVSNAHASVWARDIAQAMLEQTPQTLQ